VKPLVIIFCFKRYVPNFCNSERKYQAVPSRLCFCHPSKSCRLKPFYRCDLWLLGIHNATITFTHALGTPRLSHNTKRLLGFEPLFDRNDVNMGDLSVQVIQHCVWYFIIHTVGAGDSALCMVYHYTHCTIAYPTGPYRRKCNRRHCDVFVLGPFAQVCWDHEAYKLKKRAVTVTSALRPKLSHWKATVTTSWGFTEYMRIKRFVNLYSRLYMHS
jgi:hypothetical protein